MATSVILKDGYEVAEINLTAVLMNLNALNDEHLVALIDLVEKCKDPASAFPVTALGDSRTILKHYSFLNEHDEIIHEDVRRIVLNSIKGSCSSLEIVSPIDKSRVTG